jgi:nucleolar protein 58
VSKSLKSFLKKQLKKSGNGDSLAIADKNLVAGIKDAVPNLPCSLACDSKTNELFRGIRCYLDELMEGGSAEDDGQALSGADLNAMRLGLSHSLSRYKLKFSADKVDTMVIQAIGLLDELDKEINTYAMRVKEWYGWHFPGKFYTNFDATHAKWFKHVLTIIFYLPSFNRVARNRQR